MANHILQASVVMAASQCKQAQTFHSGTDLVNLESPAMASKALPAEGCVFSAQNHNHILESAFELPNVSAQDNSLNVTSLQLLDSVEDTNNFDWSFAPIGVLDHRVATVSRREIILP